MPPRDLVRRQRRTPGPVQVRGGGRSCAGGEATLCVRAPHSCVMKPFLQETVVLSQAQGEVPLLMPSVQLAGRLPQSVYRAVMATSSVALYPQPYAWAGAQPPCQLLHGPACQNSGTSRNIVMLLSAASVPSTGHE